MVVEDLELTPPLRKARLANPAHPTLVSNFSFLHDYATQHNFFPACKESSIFHHNFTHS